MFKMGCSMARKMLAPGAAGSSSAADSNNSPGDRSAALTPEQRHKKEQSALGGGGGGSANNLGKSKSQDPQGGARCGGGATPRLRSSDELNDFSKLEEDPRLPLNVRQIFKITKSWKAIARTMSKTGTAMFLNLFEQNQDLFYLFDRFQHLISKQALHESMELREHAATVMSTLDLSINLLADYDDFVSYLHSIGKLHRKVPGFKREHFWKIEQPFLKAIKQTLDERCNETIEEIYKIAIKLIIETIADGYGDDDTDKDDATHQAAGGDSGAGSPLAPPPPPPDASGNGPNLNGGRNGAGGDSNAPPGGGGAGGGPVGSYGSGGGGLESSSSPPESRQADQTARSPGGKTSQRQPASFCSCPVGGRSDRNRGPLRSARGVEDTRAQREQQLFASVSSSPNAALQRKASAAKDCATTDEPIERSKLIGSASGMIQSMEQFISPQFNNNDNDNNNSSLMRDALRSALCDMAKEIRAEQRRRAHDDDVCEKVLLAKPLANSIETQMVTLHEMSGVQESSSSGSGATTTTAKKINSKQLEHDIGDKLNGAHHHLNNLSTIKS